MFAAENGILQAFFGACVIPVVAVAKGNRDVGLLNVTQHLAIELFLQVLRRPTNGSCIGVLSFEVSNGFRVLFVAEPCVVIHQRVPVECGSGPLRPGHRMSQSCRSSHTESGYRSCLCAPKLWIVEADAAVL